VNDWYDEITRESSFGFGPPVKPPCASIPYLIDWSEPALEAVVDRSAAAISTPQSTVPGALFLAPL